MCRLKAIVYSYAAGGGCELAEQDLAAVLRRLDHDCDGEVSFADFFNRLLPYFIYSGSGITQSNQATALRPLPHPLRKKTRSTTKGRPKTAGYSHLRKRSTGGLAFEPEEDEPGRALRARNRQLSERQLEALQIGAQVGKYRHEKENKMRPPVLHERKTSTKLNRQTYIDKYN